MVNTSIHKQRLLYQLTGLILIVGGQLAWYFLNEQPLYGFIIILFAVGLLLFSTPPQNFVPSAAIPMYNPFRPDKNIAFRGVFALIAILLVFYNGWRETQGTTATIWSYSGVWLLSIVFSFLALMPSQKYKLWLYSLNQHKIEWAQVVLLITIGLGIRLIHLGTFPDMIAEDEGYFAWQASEIKTVHYWNQSPFHYDVHGHPLLFHLFQTISIEFFGQTVFAARFPAALLGALTIGGVYLTARLMFDRRIALIAALFMLTFPQHVHFSRLALNQPMDAFSISFVLAFLVAAVKSQKTIYYSLTGFALGLSQYGYSSARLIPALVVAYLIWAFLFQRPKLKTPNMRPTFINLTICLLIFAVTVFPLVHFISTDATAKVSPRLADIGVWEKTAVWGLYSVPESERTDFWIKQITRTFLGFVQLNETSYFYGDFNPFLGWFATVPFIIGLLVSLRGWRNPNLAILFISWILIAIFGGVLLTKPPEFQRFTIITPPIAILVALGIVFIAETIANLSKQLSPQQLMPRIAEYWLLPVILVIGLCLIDAKTYFQDYREARPYFGNYRTDRLNKVADEVLPTLIGTQVWYVSAPDLNLSTSPILKYKAPAIRGIGYEGPANELKNTLSGYLTLSHQPQAVIMAPHHLDVQEFYEILAPISEVTVWMTVIDGEETVLVYVFYFEPPIN